MKKGILNEKENAEERLLKLKFEGYAHIENKQHFPHLLELQRLIKNLVLKSPGHTVKTLSQFPNY